MVKLRLIEKLIEKLSTNLTLHNSGQISPLFYCTGNLKHNTCSPPQTGSQCHHHHHLLRVRLRKIRKSSSAAQFRGGISDCCYRVSHQSAWQNKFSEIGKDGATRKEDGSIERLNTDKDRLSEHTHNNTMSQNQVHIGIFESSNCKPSLVLLLNFQFEFATSNAMKKRGKKS